MCVQFFWYFPNYNKSVPSESKYNVSDYHYGNNYNKVGKRDVAF